MRARITKLLVDRLEPAGERRLRVYDETLKGFGVTANVSGTKSFFIEFGPKWKRRRMTLGQYGPLTVQQARDMAKVKLGEITQGRDPLVERQLQRQVPTFASWVETYMAGVRRRKKQPRHDQRYLSMAKTKWGARPVDKLTLHEVQREMEVVAARGHTTANRWLASVRACLQEACRQGFINTNPAAGIRPYRENPPRARVLSDDEFRRVVAAIQALKDPYVRTAYVLLMDTGARKSEVLRAKWEDFDLKRGLWRIPSPKAGVPQMIPLGESTVSVLSDLNRFGTWLLPGRDPTQPRKDLKRSWEQIRTRAKIDGVTIHDLRRTFGLHIAQNAGVHIASKLLRHSDIRVTERVYVPLGIETMRAAVTNTLREREHNLSHRETNNEE